MPKDFLKHAKEEYDVVVIGSGLAGLTAANILGRVGYSVLLLEQHYKLGGMATWFKRPGGHIFDVSLHGFPHGMIKSCRRYWSKAIADAIVPLENVRFDNPMFSLTTRYNRKDFTELLTGHEIWLRDGSVVSAMRGSYALPGVFKPAHRNGKWLIDGADTRLMADELADGDRFFAVLGEFGPVGGYGLIVVEPASGMGDG